ncbi:RagB/SusD family nutrient uptake outer membrane protein [Flavobacterium sp. JP2137]|uniref:RagB/SusD family nutrient uptake outer membrane protein n=1 Tax=Flavobacterium sp. JP2137 TaxID=3414510 RepID=UPI003D2FD3B9
MKHFFIYGFLLFLLITAFFCGCSDFLDIDAPKDQIDRTKVFNDDQLATAALTNTYTLMRNNGFLSGNTSGVGYLLGCYTDELEVTDPQTIYYKNFYLCTVVSNNTALTELWNHSFKQIYNVNTILEGIELSTGLTESVKNQLYGEALAIRGILHFYLTQTFGAVPYVTTTDYNLNKQIGKLANDQVMQKAIDDLVEAEELLLDQYPTSERVRINKSVVQAFLARMYLYTENWAFAIEYTQKVINKPAFELEDLDNVFLKESKSAIWQFKPEIEGWNTLEADAYVFEALPAPYARLSQYLLNDFEPNDLRKVKWVNTVGNLQENSHAYKYKQRGSSSPSKEFSVIIRIEEMYLIAAEATAANADWQLCNDMLNSIRTRAGLSEVSVFDYSTALEAVLQERKIELFCEFGHRFYDMKRTNRLGVLATVKPNWQPYFALLPIPENELLLNTNLRPQNIGY